MIDFGFGDEVPLAVYMRIQLNLLSNIDDNALRVAVEEHFGELTSG